MEEELPQNDKPPFWRRFWWIGLVIVFLIGAVWAVTNSVTQPKEKDNNAGSSEKVSQTEDRGTNVTGFGDCPSDLSGILTHPLMDPKYIGSMIPLGNVSPPGHTSPVDHIYFNVNTDEQIPLYAPADGWITAIMADSVKKTADSDYTFDSFVVTYTICDGLVLDFAGYTDVVQPILDELATKKDSCKGDIKKVGHDNAGEQQCNYSDLKIKVTSGELIGHTHRQKRLNGGYTIPFEIWSADYNKPSPSNVDWSYYDDNRYAHNVCTFDLYSGDLKKQFEAKFGDYQINTIKDNKGNVTEGVPIFTPRTIAPVCGTLYQNAVGTIQGMWFSRKPDKNDTIGSVGATSQGISFIHNNIDPTKGEVVIGGELKGSIAGTLMFTPTQSGNVNREPSEVKADGQIYCYPGRIESTDVQNSSFDGKILVQLTDDHHLKVENQTGTCSAKEAFSSPYNFER